MDLFGGTLINSEVTIISLLIILIAIHCIGKSRKKKKDVMTQLPYPPTVGFWKALKDVIRLKGQFHMLFLHWSKELGPIYSIHLGSHRLIMLNRADMIHDAFNEPMLNGRPRDPYMLQHSNGKFGVVVSDGRGWVEQRRFLIRTLKDLGVEKIYMEKFIMGEAEEFVAKIKAEGKGKPISMNKRFYLPVLNSLWMILTGKRHDHEDTKLFQLTTSVYQTVIEAGELPYIFVHIFPWLATIGKIVSPHVRHIYRQFHILRQFLTDTILERKAHFIPDYETTTREDFLNTFLQEMNKTKDSTSSFYGDKGLQNLNAVMADFFIAGVETTATSLVWAVLHVARNPEVQKKIQNELDLVAGRGRLPTLNDRHQCPYTEAVINEILRITPVATVSVPHYALANVNFKGYLIPKGSWILPNIGSVHRDPDIWEEPTAFRPERFLSGDGKTVLHHESLVAFSLGRRKCLGERVARENIFLFVSSLCHTYNFHPDPNRPYPGLDVQSFLAFTPQPYSVVFEERT